MSLHLFLQNKLSSYLTDLPVMDTLRRVGRKGGGGRERQRMREVGRQNRRESSRRRERELGSKGVGEN